MRFSFIIAIIAFICSMVFKDPLTENAGSLVLFMVSLLSGFIGLIKSGTECD